MRRFDYSFLADASLPAEIVNNAIGIGKFQIKESVRKEKFPTVFTKLESIAKVQSVKGSNAIEGIATSDERIEEIVNQKSAPLNHNELEIAGYRDALAIVHENHENVDISEKDILNLHAIMQRQNDNIVGGKYKRTENTIVAIDNQGSRSVRFQPISSQDTPKAMEQLILAFIDARQNDRINGLFLIPCFVLDFLCIHPFLDGNGRISRLLSLLLLYKNGFDAGKYISFEGEINKRKSDYYTALQASSANWLENKNDYFPFMQNFISTLYVCYKELDARLGSLSDKKMTARLRIENAIKNSILPLSKQEIAHILPDISVNTIAIALGQLVKDGVIVKVGNYKDAKYKLA
ncbi:MAG: Fic family protein [Clostridiales bacterium]|nr:Fic family protein [Clostridiales bacterium]